MAPRAVVVKNHHPARTLFAILVVIGALVLGAYALYGKGQQSAGLVFANLSAERNELRKAVSVLRSQKLEQDERIAILERAKQIEGNAYQKAQELFQDLQQQNLELREEVAFFRSIVASAARNKRLSIQGFVVSPLEPVGTGYQYRLVLTRGLKSDRVVAGSLKIVVVGELDGESTRLADEALFGPGHKTLQFRFRDFQKISGVLRFPAGFDPQRVEFRAVAKANRWRAEKVFDWPHHAG